MFLPNTAGSSGYVAIQPSVDNVLDALAFWHTHLLPSP
jgi:hypothetical protein